MSFTRPLLISLIVGMMFHGARSVLLAERGGHGPFRTQRALSMMHYWVKCGLETGATLPEEAEYNRHVVEAWKLAQQGESYDEIFESSYSDCYLALSHMDMQVSRFRWGRPPIYVVNPELPDGFGFYLLGEDGVSATQGDDPDDINSWNKRSHHFYHKQRMRRKQMEPLRATALVTVVVFGLLMLPGLLRPAPRW